MPTIDLSDELQIYQVGRGLRLVKPVRHPSAEKDTGYYSLKRLMDSSCNVYFIDTQCAIVKINESTAEFCGFDSPNAGINKTAFDFCNKSSAKFAQLTDKIVMNENINQLFDHKIELTNGNYHKQLTMKLPWHDESNNIIGLVGFTIVLDKHSLADSMIHLSMLNLLGKNSIEPLSKIIINNPLSSSQRFENSSIQDVFDIRNNPQQSLTQWLLTDSEIDGVYLSTQQRKCLALAANVMTAKRIAEKLKISFRTVERHMENIKCKLNVNSKSELIEKIIDYYQKIHR
jgi:DNA-binding CsgD family transcriptional regulator